jgi:hypothetical protein
MNLDEVTRNFFEIKARSKKEEILWNLGLNRIRYNLVKLGLHEKKIYLFDNY